MSVMYIHMFVVVKRHQHGVLQLQTGRQLHKSVKAVITTLLILGTYVVGWMPAVLFFALTCLDCPIPVIQIQLWVRVHVAIFINCMIVVKSFLTPLSMWQGCLRSRVLWRQCTGLGVVLYQMKR
ncbi:g_PROTEIN_RECEP_F1_2 domain-containing protein [Caerostris extrusa]|uniref:G_PROTEIN_RECEP_F1_2 domain-containing protein n=1 Tax=Caerostris extrusa TaxID=172846 RepID=A0AAV4NTK9_CAEEX|nr:g_PROTEIN_RECEP_F1_2 domain-containing protein [Caerostris extrusa]